jgi:PAS domain S-box-containing protein
MSDQLLLVRCAAEGSYVCAVVNLAFARFWGVEGRDLREGELARVLPRSLSRELKACFDEARATPEGIKDTRGVSAPAGGRTLELNVVPIREPDGACTHLLWTACDVTERLRIEELQKEFTNRQRALVHSLIEAERVARLGNWEWDLRTGKVERSPMLYELLGLRPGDLGGEPADFQRHVHAADRERMQTALRQSATDGTPYDQKYRLVRADGTVLWVHSVARVARDDEGRPIRLTGATRDITDEHATMQALRKSRRRLREAERIARIGHWEWRVEENRFWRSDTIYEAVGATENEAGTTVEDFLAMVHPEDRARMKELLDRCSRQGISWDTEYRILRSDGAVRHLHSVSKVTSFSNGVPRTVLGVTRDVTEQHQAAEEIRRSREELRRLSGKLLVLQEEERTRIARELHDEFGQALTALKIDVAWLRGHLHAEQEELRQKAGEMAALLDSTIRAMRKTVMELRPAILDEAGFAEAVRWQLDQFQARSGLQVRLSTRGRGREKRDGVSGPLFRILQEALTNVLRHANASRVEVTLTESGEGFEMTITDDGSGFDVERARQAHSYGLLGMRERAELIGGKLSILTEQGKGTTITLRCPVQAPPSGC